ncbi:MAG: anti-sigma factor antagonist [Frankiales bacterium]|nr:anti-sigma factor antagonist [Frankiales bacterium]
MHVADTPALRITADAEGATTVLRLAGELDLATADLLRERVRELLGRGSAVRRLALDLAGLEFLDVTGLGALLEARRKLTELGGTLTLRRPRPMVVRMLNLLNLEEALLIEG